MKVHKRFFQDDMAECSFNSEGFFRRKVKLSAWNWKHVTCKRCLAKRKGKK